MVSDHQTFQMTVLAEGGIGQWSTLSSAACPEVTLLARQAQERARVASRSAVGAGMHRPVVDALPHQGEEKAWVSRGGHDQCGMTHPRPHTTRSFAERGIGQWSTLLSAARAEGYTSAASGTLCVRGIGQWSTPSTQGSGWQRAIEVHVQTCNLHVKGLVTLSSRRLVGPRAELKAASGTAS